MFSCRAPILSSTLARLPSSFQLTDCHIRDATPAAKPAAAITVLAASSELIPAPDTRQSCQECLPRYRGCREDVVSWSAFNDQTYCHAAIRVVGKQRQSRGPYIAADSGRAVSGALMHGGGACTRRLPMAPGGAWGRKRPITPSRPGHGGLSLDPPTPFRVCRCLSRSAP